MLQLASRTVLYFIFAEKYLSRPQHVAMNKKY